MAVAADAVISFDQLVRIFVDTDVDTHFIVSIVRTSTVAELRELVKVTHRHCYPGKGDIEIGQLVVPGGEHGYHLADFLRVGQVYDKDNGKLFAEVKSCDPASSNRDGLTQMPALSFGKSSTFKKVPLLAPQPLVGEPCAQLAVESWKELIEPKLLKEEADGDVDCLLGSQEPLDRLPGVVSGLADSLEEPTDGRLLENLGAVLCDGGAQNAEAPLVTKVSSLDQDLFIAEPDRISEGVTPALTFDIKGVSRKRDSSVSNERPSKSRKLAEAPGGSTSNVPEANGRRKVRSAALDWKGGDRLNPDGMHEDANELTGDSLSQINRSGDLGSHLLSSSGRKRKKKKKQHVLNLDLTTSENRNEALDGEPPGVEVKEERCDAKTEKEEDAGPAICSGVVGSGSVGIEVDRGKKSDSLPDGPSLSPALLPKRETKRQEQEQEQKPDRKLTKSRKNRKCESIPGVSASLNHVLNQSDREHEQEKTKTKKRREQRQEHKPDKRLTKTRKNKKCEPIPVVSASLNHVLNESDREHEQENGQCTYVTSALVDPGHQLIAKATSPNHSQHVNNNEEVDNIALKDVEKIKTRKKLRKKGTSLSVDVSDEKGSLNSGRPSVLNLSKDEASENGIPGGEAQLLNETSGEGMIRNGAELANIDDEVLSPRKNLNSIFNDAETNASGKGGSGASLAIQAAEVGSVESQESPNSSKEAGRGAPSETRHSESSHDVMNGERRNTKATEIQSFQGSEKIQQHSEGENKGSEVSAAEIRPVRVKRSPSYLEANSGHVIASPGRVAHVSSDQLEGEPGRIDQFKVAEPDKVALSGTCTGESSAKSDPKSANQTKVGNQHDLSRKEDRIRKALRTSPPPNSVRSPERRASPKRHDGRETNLKIDSLQFFSQDQSFQVAPTQVAKALSDNTIEDNSDESDINPDEETDEFKKQKVDNLGISEKGVGESDDSSDETGRRDDPPLTTRIPVPLVSGSGGMKSSQIFKRRASGVPADIEAKFAHFIESQDGLDELMGITLGQRKRSMPIEPLTQAGSLATAADTLFDLPSNTQESVKNCSMTLPGRAPGLERYQAIDLAPASQISTGKLLTPQFKVPKPVTIEKISGADLGAATALQSSGKEVPKTGVKALRLKRTDSIKQADKKKERKSLPEKHNDASLSVIHESSEKISMDDQGGAEEKQTPAGLYNLLYTPESLKETFRNDLNTATNRKSSVEKTSKERKRPEVPCQDAQFMIAINTDHVLDDKREEEKLESNQETKGPSCVIEDAPNTTGKKRKERKIRESLETGLIGSQDASGFDASGKKKKRKTSETGEKRKKKRKLDIEEVTILRETSVDRSARETEELYLKFEKSNKKFRLQSGVLSLKEGAGKTENRVSPAANSDPIDPVEGEDVTQSKLEGGVAIIYDTDNNVVNLMSDTPVPGGIAADSKLSPDLCGGTSEASDREDGVFVSEDEKVAAAHQYKLQKDVFDFVSEDETPMNTVSKSAKSGLKQSKAQRLEDVASRAVQRVLEDEMLHVTDSTPSVGKKSRKVAVPVKWTVRMRGSPIALATSLHGGTVPSDAIYPTQLVSSPHFVSKSTGDVDGGAQVERGLEDATEIQRTLKVRKIPKAKPKQSSGAEICPVGCGRLYTAKTSAYYNHKRTCTGAPTEKFYKRQPRKRMVA